MYNTYMYTNRYKNFGGGDHLLGDACAKNDLSLGDFIHLRMATCPIFKWGSE